METKRGQTARHMANKWKGHNLKKQWWIIIYIHYRMFPLTLSRGTGTKVKRNEKRIWISKSKQQWVWVYTGITTFHKVCFYFSLPECDFEENHLCGFVNRWNPNVNWFVGGGNIRNSHSILPQDHTFKNELGELGTNGVCLFVCLFFMATPVAYGSSQAKGWIWAASAGLHHSHSNARSKLSLHPTPQLTATPDP